MRWRRTSSSDHFLLSLGEIASSRAGRLEMAATQWAPSTRADKTAIPSTAAVNTASGASFSQPSTAYIRSSMVANSAGLAEALETSARTVEEQHSRRRKRAQ